MRHRRGASRTTWLARAIAGLDERDRRAAARLVVSLLPDQARTVRPRWSTTSTSRASAPFGWSSRRAAPDAWCRGRARRRTTPRSSWTRRPPSSRPSRPAGARAVPAQVARGRGAPVLPSAHEALAGAAAPALARGRPAGGGRARRRAGRARARVGSAVGVDRGRHAFAVTLSVSGCETCRVRVGDGTPLDVMRVDETGHRAIVASTGLGRVYPRARWARRTPCCARPNTARCRCSRRRSRPAVAPATVLGDLAAATTLLSWFDRVQGLKPRA